jgi:anti-sigma B factor antagonist
MQPMKLETTIRALPDGAVIELRGDIDGTARETLVAAYDSSAPTGSLLLDFEQVSYINSTGIALIVDLLARARADERSVAARGLSDHYREIFQITRIADFMTLADDPPVRTNDQGEAR